MPQEIRKIIFKNQKWLKLSLEKYVPKPEEEKNSITDFFDEEFCQKATSLSIVEK